MTSRGKPSLSYMARKNNGSMTIIMPSTAKLTFPLAFNRKNTGTPIRAADPKQSNCRFVKLNKIFDFTRVKSRGTGIYATN